jgi:hypothetical protein
MRFVPAKKEFREALTGQKIDPYHSAGALKLLLYCQPVPIDTTSLNRHIRPLIGSWSCSLIGDRNGS